nr:hypothetical protein [Mycobacterium eburneum]
MVIGGGPGIRLVGGSWASRPTLICRVGDSDGRLCDPGPAGGCGSGAGRFGIGAVGRAQGE